MKLVGVLESDNQQGTSLVIIFIFFRAKLNEVDAPWVDGVYSTSASVLDMKCSAEVLYHLKYVASQIHT